MCGLAEPPDADPVEAIRRYLARRATPSARALAEKAVVLIEPARLQGVVGWSPTDGAKQPQLPE